MTSVSASTTTISNSQLAYSTSIAMASGEQNDILVAAAVERSDAQGHDKYKHIYAIHAKCRTSTLSHDAMCTPSFIGFRNLMVIVLSMRQLHLWFINEVPNIENLSCWKFETCDWEFYEVRCSYPTVRSWIQEGRHSHGCDAILSDTGTSFHWLSHWTSGINSCLQWRSI